MRIVTFGVIALLAATFAFGCNNQSGGMSTTGANPSAGAAAQQDVGETLATVNGMVVGSKEFEQAAARKQPAEGDSLSLEEKQEVLDRLVEEKLLYEAALKAGLDKDPKVQKVMVNTLLRQDVYSSVRNSDFTDEELQAYFEAHKDEFVVPEKVQIKRILVKITDDRPEAEAQKEAERIQGELAKDLKQFKDMAAKYSEDPYRRRGGDVGFVPKGGKPGLDPDVVDKAFSMNVETLSEAFKTSEGFNIIYVANKRERVERTFQQMKGSVLRKVKNEKLKEKYEQYVAGLRKDADVKVNQDKLALVEVKSARRNLGPGFAINPGGDEEEGQMMGGEEGEEEGAEQGEQ